MVAFLERLEESQQFAAVQRNFKLILIILQGNTKVLAE